MDKNVVLIGASGHAKVIADVIQKSGDKVFGFLDDNEEQGMKIEEYESFKYLGKISNCEELSKQNPNLEFIIAIGNNQIRNNIAEKYKLKYYTAIAPSANIGFDVKIGEGTVIMHNACINPSTTIGKHCIINTGAIVEHDNAICDYVHISPNATLCGTVKIGRNTHIGAGSVVKNNISITNNCVIGVGAAVVKNIEKKGTYIGVPAKIKEGK